MIISTARFKQLIVFISTLAAIQLTFANPQGGVVAAGSASISQSGNVEVIQQSSNKAIINWQSFNIAAGEKTHFQQPVNGIALNRISPTMGASQIYGQLTATGKIILVNQSGIYFGPTAHVDVGGIIASTSDISDAHFLAGKYTFDKASPYAGSVINEGMIRAADQGLVALVGTGVRNDGTIEAHLGNIVLASGDKFTVDLYGDQLVNFTVDQATSSAGVDPQGKKLNDGVANSGALLADGGRIIITARSARSVVDNAINMKGVAQARSVHQQGGEIILDGGDGVVRVAGKINVSGKKHGQHGGTVKILAKNVHIESPAVIDASGNAGGGEILIGGNEHGQGPESNAYSTQVDKGVQINADAIQNGNGGKVIVWADNDTQFYGNISARGGLQGGDGGFVETSGKKYLSVADATIDLSAPLGKTGTWLLDPENVTIASNGGSNVNESLSGGTFSPTGNNAIVDVSNLVTALGTANIIVTTGSTGSQAGDITVANSINWSSANSLTLSAYRNIIISPATTISNTVGASLTLQANNTGAFAVGSGSGIVTNNGTIQMSGGGQVNVYYNPSSYTSPTSYTNTGNDPLTAYMLVNNVTDLQNMNTNLSGNYALSKDIDASATSGWNSGTGFLPVGDLVTDFTGNFDGQNHTIDSLYINNPSLDYVGLFGAISSDTISNVGITNVYIRGGEVGTDTGVGGLAALSNHSTVNNVYVTGSVNQLALLNNCDSCGVGGLIGIASSTTIQNSYNAASVTAAAAGGGLVGSITEGTIADSYNSGTITALFGSVGGLTRSTTDTVSIINSYNVGTLNGSAGGLVLIVSSGNTTITDSYSSGQMSGSTSRGLVSSIRPGATLTVNNSFWDTETTGQTGSAGSTGAAGYMGMTTQQMMTQDNFTQVANGFVTTPNAWDFTNTWYTPNYGVTSSASTRPILQSEYSTTISNGHQLQLVQMHPTANYTLASNIDLTGTSNPSEIWGSSTTSGNGFVPLGDGSSPFHGVFNGAGHIINGLYINRSSDAALFINANAGSTIENVGLTGVNINYTFSNANAAALVAVLSGSVLNSFSTGTIQGTGTANQITAGGLVGTNNGGLISNSYSTVGVGSTGTDPSLVFDLGGLVGKSVGGTITDSYSTGNVAVGAGSSGVTNVGGLLGLDAGSSTFTHNYWDAGTSGQTNSEGAGSTTAANPGCYGNTSCAAGAVDLTHAASFTGWDFTNTWGIIEGTSYPYLKVFYPTSTPRVIAGTTSASSGTPIGLANNGSKVDAVDTGNNGFFYFLEGGIADNSPYLVYINNASTVSNLLDVAPASGGSITSLNLSAPNMIKVNTGTTGFSTDDMVAAIGSISDTGILYSYSASTGNLALLGDGTILQTTGTGAFTIDHTISSSGANDDLDFHTPVTINTTSISTSGTQTYNNPVTLTASPILGANGDINFVSTLDGAFDLFVSTGGTTSFNGIVGGTIPLNSLTTDSSGATNIGADIATVGVQTYNNPVTLTANSLLKSTGSGDIDFTSTLDGGFDLSVSTGGLTSFNSTVGGITPLNSLATDVIGATNIGASITTVNAQTYNNPVTLTTSPVLASNSDINFVSTLDGGFDLFVSAAGTTSFSGAVGKITPLNTLITDSIGSTNIGADITTVGVQTYNNPVTLTGNSSLTSTIKDDIDFVSTLDGAFDLTVNTGGVTSFDGTVGGIIPLNSLTTDADGSTSIGANITTVGAQTYNDPVALGADVTSTGVGSITFEGAVTLAVASPTVRVENGDITFNSSITGQDLNLTGGAGNNIFTLPDGLALNNITIDGGAGNNTLNLQNNTAAQAWTINAADSGTLGVSGLSGTLSFSNVGNLVGGTNANTFSFVGNASVSGSIDGGNTTNVNTIDFTGYAQPVILTLDIPLSGHELNSGSITSNSLGIGSFTQIQQVNNSVSGGGIIVLPNKPLTITYTNSPANTAGFISDPFYFNNFVLQSAPVPPPTPPAESSTSTSSAPSSAAVNNTVISATTADIVNQNNMDITTTGLNNFVDSFSEAFVVNVNIDQLLKKQKDLVIEETKNTTFGCL